jgi:hypothetical protein
LKQETLNKYLNDQSQKKLTDQLDIVRTKFQIGVVKETTAFERLINNDYHTYPYDTRVAALAGLKADTVQAFASDAIILRSLLDEESEGGKTYRDLGYVIFPAENYLLNIKTEKYAIAISNKDKNAQYSYSLKEATDQVLSQPKFDEQRKELEQYEKEQPQPSTSLSSQPNPAKGGSVSQKASSSTNSSTNSDWWVQIVVAIIAATATLGAAYWQFRSGRKG